MTAHVFIVDDTTFPLHLQYQFAGIGAGTQFDIDFNNSAESKIHHSTEKNLVGMIADMSRIRRGDRVFFYVQKPGSNGNDGAFYGIFRVCEDAAFLDKQGKKGQFLYNELGKSLTFRVVIEPEDVYPEGVTEWHALDEIRNIAHPYEMLWSLIYRKLKGKRGCTMITHYEEKYLRTLISKNQNAVDVAGCALNFDLQTRKIFAENSAPPAYEGERTPFNMLPRMLAIDGPRQIETYLQAEIIRQIGRANDPLTGILMNGKRPDWIGNEVSCGVGMQRIDIMLARNGQKQHLTLIELKSVEVSVDNIRQIQRYVDWAEQYYIPNSPAIIEPVLIARKTPGDLPDDFLQAAAKLNQETAGRTCAPLRLVEFVIDGEQIRYQERKITAD